VPSHRADAPALRRSRKQLQAPVAPPAQRSRRSDGPRRQSPRGQQRSVTQLSAPQVGIAGALGLATIAAPISGVMSGPAPKAQINPISAVSLAPAPAFPARSATAVIGVEALSVVPAPVSVAAAPRALAAPRTVIVSRASRSRERSVLPGCDGIAKITNAPNGQIPSNELCTLWESGEQLRADAAVALAKLNIGFKQRFGENLCVTDSYRSISQQYRLKSIKPGLAATPGTSEHGWGMAVDLCDGIQSGSGARFQWLRANAASYGWENPDWARHGGGGPYEPWHWEFNGS
jgi:zinc D-Ala-D-Ala carboxypeptidase